MRLKRLLPVLLVTVALATGLVWCAGPCCAATATSPPGLSIGTVSCCGAGTPGRCQPSVQSADAAAVPQAAIAHSPLLPSIGPVAPDAILTLAGPRAPYLLVPWLGLCALHIPLLI